MADPLGNPAFKEPGVLEILSELFRGQRRLVDCVQVEVSSVCTARCEYCPQSADAGRWKARHMEAGTFAALWPLLRRSARVHLQGWGEPFLHPRFFDFTAFARKAGCAVSSTSCGLHMDEGIARRVVKSGMDVLAFSLAGTDEASNAIRRGAPFTKVCDNIRLMSEIRKKSMAVHLSLHCAYILLADRMEAVLALPDLASELGLHVVVVSTLDYIAAPGQESLAFAPHEADKIARARDLLEKAAARAAKLELEFHYALPCPEPWGTCRENVERSLYVDAGGALSPCIYVNVPVRDDNERRRVFGNANETDAFACWQGERFSAFREALETGNPEAPCVQCAKRFEKMT
ncbi:MAG: radical SAM protein [Desulfovibrionaceae bacterium]|nr:radical SAM protein [Desulfovibrionaceae bacterium]